MLRLAELLFSRDLTLPAGQVSHVIRPTEQGAGTSARACNPLAILSRKIDFLSVNRNTDGAGSRVDRIVFQQARSPGRRLSNLRSLVSDVLPLFALASYAPQLPGLRNFNPDASAQQNGAVLSGPHRGSVIS